MPRLDLAPCEPLSDDDLAAFLAEHPEAAVASLRSGWILSAFARERGLELAPSKAREWLDRYLRRTRRAP